MQPSGCPAVCWGCGGDGDGMGMGMGWGWEWRWDADKDGKGSGYEDGDWDGMGMGMLPPPACSSLQPWRRHQQVGPGAVHTPPQPAAPGAHGRAWGETSRGRENQIKFFPFSRNNCLPNYCCNYCPTGKSRKRKALQREAGKLDPGEVQREAPPTCLCPTAAFSNFPPNLRGLRPPAVSGHRTPEKWHKLGTWLGWDGLGWPPPPHHYSSVTPPGLSLHPELSRTFPRCTGPSSPTPSRRAGPQSQNPPGYIFLPLSLCSISPTRGVITTAPIVFQNGPLCGPERGMLGLTAPGGLWTGGSWAPHRGMLSVVELHGRPHPALPWGHAA